MGQLDLFAILTKVHIRHANGLVVGVLESHQPRTHFLNDDVDLRLGEWSFLDDSVLELFLQVNQYEVVSDVQLHVGEEELLLLEFADDSEAEDVLLRAAVSVDLVQDLFALLVLFFVEPFLGQGNVVPQGRHSLKMFFLLRRVKHILGDVQVGLGHV